MNLSNESKAVIAWYRKRNGLEASTPDADIVHDLLILAKGRIEALDKWRTAKGKAPAKAKKGKAK